MKELVARLVLVFSMSEFDMQTVKKYLQTKLRHPWQVTDDTRIRLQLELTNFDEVIALVNHIAKIANRADHHPNLHICGNILIIELYTHDSNSISEKDLQLATEIEKIL